MTRKENTEAYEKAHKESLDQYTRESNAYYAGIRAEQLKSKDPVIMHRLNRKNIIRLTPDQRDHLALLWHKHLTRVAKAEEKWKVNEYAPQ